MTDSRPVYRVNCSIQPITDKFSDRIPSGIVQKSIDASNTGVDCPSNRFSDVGAKIWHFNETTDKGTNGLTNFLCCLLNRSPRDLIQRIIQLCTENLSDLREICIFPCILQLFCKIAYFAVDRNGLEHVRRC